MSNAHITAIDTDVGGLETGGDRYRWVCSCDCTPGEWKTREFQARQGASKHVAAMERRR